MGSYIFKFTEKFDFDRLKDVFEAVQGVITNGIYLLKETFIRVVTVHKERKISKSFQIVTQNVSCFYRLALQLRVGVHSFFYEIFKMCQDLTAALVQLRKQAIFFNIANVVVLQTPPAFSRSCCKQQSSAILLQKQIIHKF